MISVLPRLDSVPARVAVPPLTVVVPDGYPLRVHADGWEADGISLVTGGLARSPVASTTNQRRSMSLSRAV
jgi:hypothetical protein